MLNVSLKILKLSLSIDSNYLKKSVFLIFSIFSLNNRQSIIQNPQLMN